MSETDFKALPSEPIWTNSGIAPDGGHPAMTLGKEVLGLSLTEEAAWGDQ